MKTLIQRAGLTGLALLALMTSAEAHAILTKSTPAIGGHAASGTIKVELHYNSRVDPKRSLLTLIKADRKTETVPIGEASTSDTIVTSLALPAGRYTLRWQVLAVDGHITRGDVPFTVDP